MYLACRHIKPNGLRCKSPALKGNAFCYYHARLHTISRLPLGKHGPISLPVAEDTASIQLSIAQICDALLNDRIDTARAGRLLYAMQIASHTIDRKTEFCDAETVPSAVRTNDGDDLAPELRVCKPDERCEQCPYRQGCPNFHKHEEDPNDEEVLLRTLVSLGKHLEDPVPESMAEELAKAPSVSESSERAKQG